MHPTVKKALLGPPVPDVYETLEIVKAAAEAVMWPWSLGTLEVTYEQSLKRSDTLRVKTSTFPDEVCLLVFSPYSLAVDPTWSLVNFGENVGRYFLSLKEPVPSNVHLGEN